MSEAGPETVFPNGPTVQWVEEQKQKYGDVFESTLGADTFIWRRLTRPEYREIVGDMDMDGFAREDEVCAECVIWPPEAAKKFKDAGYPAGYPGTISDFDCPIIPN